MGTRTTSPTLLARVRDPADAAAWRQFEARYGELILRFCRRRGLRFFDSEDIRQIVMMRLVRALRRFEYDPRQGRFRAFLGRIVQNEIARYASRPNAAALGVDISAAGSPAAEGSDADDPAWEREWIEHHLRLAMRRLRATQEGRSLDVFDRLLKGRSVADVAREFGMTQEAVHKVKQRVRDRLRELVAAQIEDEDPSDG